MEYRKRCTQCGCSDCYELSSTQKKENNKYMAKRGGTPKVTIIGNGYFTKKSYYDSVPTHKGR